MSLIYTAVALPHTNRLVPVDDVDCTRQPCWASRAASGLNLLFALLNTKLLYVLTICSCAVMCSFHAQIILPTLWLSRKRNIQVLCLRSECRQWKMLFLHELKVTLQRFPHTLFHFISRVSYSNASRNVRRIGPIGSWPFFDDNQNVSHYDSHFLSVLS